MCQEYFPGVGKRKADGVSAVPDFPTLIIFAREMIRSVKQPVKILYWFNLFSLAVLLIALPLSRYLMSISEFMLAGAFILDGIRRNEVFDFYRQKNLVRKIFLSIPFGIKWIGESLYFKFSQFFRRDNMAAIIFSSIFLLHLIGLIYTVDFDYALKDLRIKLPIFLLPLVLSTTGTMDRKHFQWLLGIFVAAVMVGTFNSTYILLTQEVENIRKISPFISHIRFGLLIDMAIFILFYAIAKKNEFLLLHKVIMALITAWLLTYLVISTTMTGIVIFLVTCGALIIYLIFQKKNMFVKISVIAVMVLILAGSVLYINSIFRDVYKVMPVKLDSMDKITTLGNPYWNDTTNKQVENGNYVWLYVATDELKDAWNKRSSFNFDGKDKEGQEIKYTLIRFLTSKGYRKDAEGVSRLTDAEVHFIESGVASTVYVEKSNLYVRIYKIIWEIREFELKHNPSGHSVTQRIEFWRTSLAIIHDNWLTGVGTGDMNLVFQQEYEKLNTPLEKKFRWRSHNQFLSFFVAFGIFGLAWFLFCLVYPPLRLKKFKDYYYLVFFIIICLSMMWEDTIESQEGVTIFAFFSSFFLFFKKFKDPI
jgi:hypothetical protein